MRRTIKRVSPLLVTALLGALPMAAAHARLPETAATQTVTNANLGDWQTFTPPNNGASGGIGFVEGPEDTPAGTGSVEFRTGPGDGTWAGRHFVRTTSLAGATLAGIRLLQYSSYIQQRDAGSAVAPYVRLHVDYGDGVTGMLVYEPVYSTWGIGPDPTTADQWQRWDAVGPTAHWWSPHEIPGVCTDLCYVRWAEIVAANPTATVAADGIDVGAGDRLATSTPWNNFVGNVDDVRIVAGGSVAKAYDFEHASVGSGGSDHDLFVLGDGDAANQLWRVDVAAPLTTVTPPSDVAGLQDDEVLVGMDFSPANGELYAVARTKLPEGVAATGRLYRVDVDTSPPVAHAIETSAFVLAGTSFGVEFDATDPVAPVLQVVSDADVRVAIDPVTGLVTRPGVPLAYHPTDLNAAADPHVAGIAYRADSDEAALFGIDVELDTLVRFGADTSLVETVDVLKPAADTDGRVGLDTAPDGTVYASLTHPRSSTASGLRRVDTADAGTAFVGDIGGDFLAADVALPPTGTIHFDKPGYTMTENGGTLSLTVERTGGSYADLTVRVRTSGGTATPGSDYSAFDRILTFPAGSTESQQVELTVLDDDVADGDKTVEVVVERVAGSGPHIVGAPSQATVTINDSEVGSLQFAEPEYDVDESVSGGIVTVEVTRNGGNQGTVTIDVVSASGTATEGEDFTAVGTTLTFASDDDSQTVQVPILDDDAFEGDETFELRLDNATAGAVIGTPGTAEVTVNDDPAGALEFTALPYEGTEGSEIALEITRSGGTEGAAAVDVGVTGGTATGPAPDGDFSGIDPAAVTWAAGTGDAKSTALVTVDDKLLEGDETVELALQNPTGGVTVGATATATAVIQDLEVRSAYALNPDGQLVTFDPETPGSASSPLPITFPVGVAGGEILGIDFRPADAEMYAVVRDETTTLASLYRVDVHTGASSAVAFPVPETCLPTPLDAVCVPPQAVGFAGVPLSGEHFAADWDPVADVMRVVSDGGLHMTFEPMLGAAVPNAPLVYTPVGGPEDVTVTEPEIDPGTPPSVTPGEVDPTTDPPTVDQPSVDPGTPPGVTGGGADVTTDPNAGSVPAVVAFAHTDNLDGTDVTTVYAVDHAADDLVRLGSPDGDPLPPASGVVSSVAALSGPTTEVAGMDVRADGSVYTALTDGGTTTLHTLDLATGELSEVGQIADGGPFHDLALAPKGLLQFSGNTSRLESAGNEPITVRRIGGSNGTVSVDYASDGGSATPGQPDGGDYSPVSGTLTFDHGVTEQTFTLQIHDDEDVEGNETVILELSNPQGGGMLGSAATATHTVTDDPQGTVQLTSGSQSVSEEAGAVPVTAERIDGTEGELSIGYATATDSGTNPATADVDYTHETGQIVFPHDSTDNQSFDVAILDDHDEEADETFRAELTSGPLSGATSQVVTITNVDDAGSVGFQSATYEEHENGATAMVTLERLEGSDGAVSVELSTADQTGAHTATAGDDYGPVWAQEVEFAHGQRTASVEVAFVDDALLEGHETLDLDLANGTPLPGDRTALDANRDEAELTIRDVEDGIVYGVTAGSDPHLVRFPVGEPDSALVDLGAITGLQTGESIVGIDFRPADAGLYAVGDTSRLYTIDHTTAAATQVGTDRFLPRLNGSAFGIDFTASGALLRVVSDAGRNFVLDPDDGTVESTDSPMFYAAGDPNETEFASGTALAYPTSGRPFVIDADLDQLARLGDVDSEPASGEMHSIGDLDAATEGDASLDIAAADGRAIATLNAASGSALHVVDLSTGPATHVGDTRTSPAQQLTLAGISFAPIGTVQFTGSSFDAGEGEDAEVEVERVDGTFGEVTVDVTDGDGTSRTVTFPHGSGAPQPTRFPVDDDEVYEEDETFDVDLSISSGDAVLGLDTATVTVVDDEEKPIVDLSRVTTSADDGVIDEGAGPASFGVALSGKTHDDVTVEWASQHLAANGTTVLAEDSGTLTLDGPGGGSDSFSAPIADDSLDEHDGERLVVTIDVTGGPADAGTSEVLYDVLDNDGPPALRVSDATLTEGDSGTTSMFFIVSLSAPSGKQVSTRVRTVGITALPGVDFRSVDTVVAFPPGTTTQQIAVRVIADGLVERDETFNVALSRAQNATIASAVGQGTIRNDDRAPAVEPPVVKGKTETNAPPRGTTTPSDKGYVVVRPDGGVQGFGDAKHLTSATAASTPSVPSVAVALTPTAKGYWLLDRQGGVHTAGDARFFGSVPGRRAAGLRVGNAPAVDIATTPSGKGYYVLDSAGGIHTFGDARFLGSIPGRRDAGQPIGHVEATSLAVTPSGNGYVVLDEVGGVHTFGDARFFGSIPGRRAAGVHIGEARAVSVALAAGGAGYWVLDDQGGVHTFGSARYLGSIPGRRAAGQVIGQVSAVAIEATTSGNGYWVFDAAGGVFTFGKAAFAGSLPGLRG